MASPSSPFRPLSQAPSAGKSSGGRRKASLPPSPPLISPPVSPSRPLFRSSARSSAFISRQPRLLRGVAPDLRDQFLIIKSSRQILNGETEMKSLIMEVQEALSESLFFKEDLQNHSNLLRMLFALPCGITSWISFVQVAQSSEGVRVDMVYQIGELFELGIQLSYLLTLLGLLGVGTFFVIRQVLVRRELDLSAKELQEQVRSGDAAATAYFELGAVMLRRKFYPAAIKYLQQAIEKWDGDDQDLAQVYNALGVSYTRDNKLDKGIAQFEKAVELQPGYTTAWNNLGDAYEKKKELRAALKAFEEVLLFDPNNKVARPRRDALRDRVQLYKGVTIKSKDE